MSWFLRKLFRLPVCSLWVRSLLGVGVGSLGYLGIGVAVKINTIW